MPINTHIVLILITMITTNQQKAMINININLIIKRAKVIMILNY